MERYTAILKCECGGDIEIIHELTMYSHTMFTCRMYLCKECGEILSDVTNKDGKVQTKKIVTVRVDE